jgi:bifunctional DNA-binding transcriptional regulator/antitoxin component of YhaV-PrlF toxin-antitoxin module
MSTETDERGRIYLSKRIREEYGERFHVVEYDDHIELVPVDDDPVEGLREAVGDAFEGRSAEELSEETEELARKHLEHFRLQFSGNAKG